MSLTPLFAAKGTTMTELTEAAQSMPPERPTRRSVVSDWVGYTVIGVALAAYFIYLQVRPVPKVGQSHTAVLNKLQEFHVDPLFNVEQPLELEQIRGKVTVINMWGPWDAHSSQQMPKWLALREKWGDRVNFVSIAYVDDADSTERKLRDDVRSKLLSTKQNFPVYWDPPLDMQRSLRKSGIFWKGKFPCTILIDAELIVRGVWMTYRPGYDEELDELLTGLIGTSQ